LNEISRDFGIRSKFILNELSETDSYIPPLSTAEYIRRISFQLHIPDKIRDHALYLVHKEETNLGATLLLPSTDTCKNAIIFLIVILPYPLALETLYSKHWIIYRSAASHHDSSWALYK
jgi:hypothetical protein